MYYVYVLVIYTGYMIKYYVLVVVVVVSITLLYVLVVYTKFYVPVVSTCCIYQLYVLICTV